MNRGYKNPVNPATLMIVMGSVIDIVSVTANAGNAPISYLGIVGGTIIAILGGSAAIVQSRRSALPPPYGWPGQQLPPSQVQSAPPLSNQQPFSSLPAGNSGIGQGGQVCPNCLAMNNFGALNCDQCGAQFAAPIMRKE